MQIEKDVIVVHIRPYDVPNNPRGGLTVAIKKLGKGEFLTAVAKCHPKDNFVKKLGLIKAVSKLKSKKPASEGGPAHHSFPGDPDPATLEGRKELIKWVRETYHYDNGGYDSYALPVRPNAGGVLVVRRPLARIWDRVMVMEQEMGELREAGPAV